MQYIAGGAATNRPMSYAAPSSFATAMPTVAYSTQAPAVSQFASSVGTTSYAPVMRPGTTFAAQPTTYTAQPAAYTAQPATYTSQSIGGATQYRTQAQSFSSAPGTFQSQTIQAAGVPTTLPTSTIVSGSQFVGQPVTTSYGTSQIMAQSATQFASQPYMQQYQTRIAAPVTSGGIVSTNYMQQGGVVTAAAATNRMSASRIVGDRVVPLAEYQLRETQQVVQPQPVVYTEPQVVYAEPAPVVYAEPQPVVYAESVQQVVETVTGADGQVEMVPAEVVTDYVQTADGQVEMVQTLVEGQPVEVIEGQEQQLGPPRVVIICTSEGQMGDHVTGAWSEEITAPYYAFTEAGCEVYVASIRGGKVPIDEASLSENFFTENDRRFQEEGMLQFLDNSYALADISPEAIDCVWLAGGHGTCMDFEANLAQFVTDAVAIGRPVGAVCHGVIGLLSAVSQDGTPLLQGKQVTGFSNAEEDQVGLYDKVPFLIQNRMEELGAAYSCGEPWTEYAMADGKIITGQNPQSSERTARLCIEAMMQP